MAIKTNIKKTMKKAEEERARAASMANFGRPIFWWKPSKGNNTIRILPPWTDKGPSKEQFWKEIYVHWNIAALDDPESDSKFNVACVQRSPGMDFFTGIPKDELKCRICEEIGNLKKSGAPEDVALAKEWRARVQFTMNVIDIDDPIWKKAEVKEMKAGGVDDKWIPEIGDPKVQVFGCGVTIFNTILDLFNEETDITDLEEGYDIKIHRTGTGKNDTKYVVNPVLKSTEAPITEEQLDKALYNLDEIVRIFTYKQVGAILAGATYEEVFELAAPASDKVLEAKKESARLTAGKKKRQEKEEVDEDSYVEQEEEDSVDEVEEYEAADEDGDEGEGEEYEDNEEDGVGEDEEQVAKFEIPVDRDGDIDYDKLDVEDIENKEYAKYIVKKGTDEEHSVHVGCFGKARERDPNDENCLECGLTSRCEARIKFLDEATKPKKKRGRPRKNEATAASETSSKKKPKTGKKNGTTAAFESLEAEMRAALEKSSESRAR